VKICVITPKFPPVHKIARTESEDYLDENIKEKAKTRGFEETRVKEIIENHINIQASFDMKTFCSALKKHIRNCSKAC